MTGPLHDYQRQAVRFALDAIASPHRGCALFLEPGLGKTLTSIAVMDVLHAADPTARFLVVAPALVARNSWPVELERWSGIHRLDHTLIAGTPKRRAELLEHESAVTIIGQELLPWLDKTVRRWPWTGIVVDELSGYKSSGSKRGGILRRRARQAGWVLGLTGTPATRDLTDLWGEVAVVDRAETLGRSVTRYRERWFRPSRYVTDGDGRSHVAQWAPRPGAAADILGRIAPFCLSMRAADRLPGLPDRLDVDHWLDMPDDTRRTYETLRRDMVAALDGATVSAANAGVLTGRLDQLTCGCLYPDRDDPQGEERGILRLDDAKLDELDHIRAGADGPLLVFYRYRAELDRMRERFDGLREIHEDGVVDEWNAGHIPMLAAQPQAARYGLNLQHGGHEIAWTSLPWSFDDYRQACDRLHRQGQERPVRVHRILESDTVDARKLDVLTGRARLHEAVMAALRG